MAKANVVLGDLLDQKAQAIVNAWNRNIIPWWLLLPQGVSGAIKRRAGFGPFIELSRKGPIPLGGAVSTGAGRLPFRSIIHVAAINMLWRASEASIRSSVRSAMSIVNAQQLESVAFPILGSGSGGFSADRSLTLMLDEFSGLQTAAAITVVRFRPQR